MTSWSEFWLRLVILAILGAFAWTQLGPANQGPSGPV